MGAFRRKPATEVIAATMADGTSSTQDIEVRSEPERHRMRSEKNIDLARDAQPGYYRLYISKREKVVFEVWMSKKYTDERGRPTGRIFPKFYEKDGEVVIRFRQPGPSLSMGILYPGFRLDPSRLAPEHPEYRADLEKVAHLIMEGVRIYDAKKRRVRRRRYH